MKNLVILLIVIVLFSAVPVFAGGWFSGPHDDCLRNGRHFHSVPWYSGDSNRTATSTSTNSASSEKTETTATPADKLGGQEAMRVFLEKGFASAPTDAEADFVVEIRMVVRPRLKCYSTSHYSLRRQCYSDPEKVVFITLKDKNDVSIAVGKGDDENFYNAVKDAAEDAANKIKEKGGSVYIYDFS